MHPNAPKLKTSRGINCASHASLTGFRFRVKSARSVGGSAQCAIQSEFGGGKEERGKRKEERGKRKEEAEGVEKAL